MKTVRHYNENELKELIRSAIEKEAKEIGKKGLKVKSVSFSTSARTDAFDRPSGGHDVSCEVEISE